MGYGDATDGAIAIGAELELTGGYQRLELVKHLLQDTVAEGSTTAHPLPAGDENTKLIAAPQFQQDLDWQRMRCGEHGDRGIAWIQPGEGSTRTRIELLKQEPQLGVTRHPREQCFQAGQPSVLNQRLIVASREGPMGGELSFLFSLGQRELAGIALLMREAAIEHFQAVPAHGA